MARVKPTGARMKAYWDASARRNAPWYVDTSLDYDNPDMDRFFETGRKIVAEALDESPVAPPGRSLAVEIGSGLGRVCAALAERFDRVIGVDVSSEMTSRARELVPDPRITFAVGDGVSLSSLESGTADLVLTFTVFQHIPETDVIAFYIEEAGRVLKKDGLFVFQWNNQPRPGAWRVKRVIMSVLQRVGLSRDRYRRHDPAFLGVRVPMVRIEEALHRGGLARRATKQEGTLWTWMWATRR